MVNNAPANGAPDRGVITMVEFMRSAVVVIMSLTVMAAGVFVVFYG
jgi:hypothetical protein